MFFSIGSSFAPFLILRMAIPLRAILIAPTLSALSSNWQETQIKLSRDFLFFRHVFRKLGHVMDVPAGNTFSNLGSPARFNLYSSIVSSLQVVRA